MEPRLAASNDDRDLTWSAFIESLFDQAAPFLSVRGDLDHTRVSHGYALTLLQEEGDPRIVEPAVILHDVGWSALEPKAITLAYGVLANGEEAERLNRIHETQGAAIARRILHSLGYEPALIQAVCEIISRHDSGKDAPTTEEAIVKDADKLWRFSRIGFWQEAERQRLNPKVLLDFLAARCNGWFFLSRARAIAEKELRDRREEIVTG